MSKEVKKVSRPKGKYQRDIGCLAELGLDEKRTAHGVSVTPQKAWEGVSVGANKPRFDRKGASRAGVPPSPTENANKTACQKWCDEVLAQGLRNIRKAFVECVKPYTPEGTRNAFVDDANADKNRYDDVELLDKTRVKITTNPEDDYIHASVVEISPTMQIICTQGPLENTAQQFWAMVVEQSSKVILQLCQNIEDGKEKCSEYMPPLREGAELEFGTAKLRVVAANMNVGSMKKVTRTLVEVSYQDKIWETTHLLYAGWPDHTVPDSLPTFVELRNLILRIRAKLPIITHCSAGVGRTGSYVGIEMAVYQLVVKQDKNFSMVETIRKLRDQRMHSVQNDQQYAFIHRMVIEILLSENLVEKSERMTKFFKEYNDLVERKRVEMEKMKVVKHK